MEWFDVVGWIGSALLVWSLLQSRLLRLRELNLVGSLVLVGYNSVVRVWPMVGLNVVLALINLWYLRSMLATRHDGRSYQVVEVGAESVPAYLRRHGADIERFNRRFEWSSDGPRLTYFVLHKDEVVGVVIVRPDGETAWIELDYVTERYRDFTPGEFVYLGDNPFTRRGFRQVVSPRDMVAPYYARIGFRQLGDLYVLDLPDRSARNGPPEAPSGPPGAPSGPPGAPTGCVDT